MTHLKRYKYFFEDGSGSATSGSGDVSNPTVAYLPGECGSDSSGDLSFYLKKRRRKKGNPSEISDLRDLEDAKTNKVEDIKESSYTEQEYVEEVMNRLKQYNIRPVVLNKYINFYMDDIINSLNNGTSIDFVVNDILSNLNLSDDKYLPTKKNKGPYYIKYL
jgi:hypothetical protein